MNGTSSSFPVARWTGPFLLTAALCACGSEAPAPPPTPAAPVEPEAQPKPEPIPEPIPEPKPEPIPEPPTPEAVARCTIVVDGRGPKIARAVVNSDSGPHKGDVEAGNAVGYDCPNEADRTNVDLIVALDNGKAAHWTGLAVGPDEAAHVTNAARQSGYPDGYTPEQLEMLEKDLGISAADASAVVTQAVPGKSSVVFMPHEFPWAELTLVAKGKRPQTITLAGQRTIPLAPGSYAVSFLDLPEGEPRAVDLPLDIEAGKSYRVKMLKRAPHMSVTVQ